MNISHSEQDQKLEHLRDSVKSCQLSILIWGPAKTDQENYKERCRLKQELIDIGHDAKFSEEFIGNDSLIDPMNDEILQAKISDAIVLFYGSRGTQSEFDRIILPNSDIAEKTYIILQNDMQGILESSVSGEGWRSLLANQDRCFKYEKVPVSQKLLDRLKHELQRRREQYGMKKVLSRETHHAYTPSLKVFSEAKTPPTIKYLPPITSDSYFYEKARIVDELSQSPSDENIKILLDLIQNDSSLSAYFYGGEKGDLFPDFGWLELLSKSGEFDDLEVLPSQIQMEHRFEADFIREAAETVPEIVFDIITTIKPNDAWIQRVFLKAVQKMPIESVEKALWLIWSYLGEKQMQDWHRQGKEAAEIMIKLLDKNPNQAFAIAGLLLEMWYVEEGGMIRSQDACIRFREHDYAEFIKNYYEQLWKKHPYQAFELLVRNMNSYLGQAIQKRDYDPSESYHYSVEKIDEGSSWKHESFVAIYMCALRDCLNYLIEHESGAIDRALGLLKTFNKAVFIRFEMYLLSKIDATVYKDRINEIAETERYFDSSCYKNECDMLVSNQYDLLTSETKKKILDYIDKIHIRDREDFKVRFKEREGRDCTDNDIIQYESRYRAQRLFPIKDAFSEEFETYKQLSEAGEDELKPTPLHSDGARFIAGDEGTPLTTAEMNKMNPEKVIDYLLTPEKYCNYKPKEFQFNSPTEALGYAFKTAVKARPSDFINVNAEKITKLQGEFVSRLFNGLWDALRENTIEQFPWDRFLEVTQLIVEKYKCDKEMVVQLRAIPECIQEGFKDTNKIEYTVERLNRIFSIVEILLGVPEERDMSNERDPFQIQCNSVTGTTFSVCLSLGIVFKRDFNPEYENSFKSKLQNVFQRVLAEIKTPWTVCTFGNDFPRIYWLMPEWVEHNLDLILSDEHWDAVWGTYLHWGRPSKDLFEMLNHKGIYSKAIGKCDDITSRNSGEKPAEELAKHFVIAYFNGWFESYEDSLLQEFLAASSDELLAFTAKFFTTGFESQKVDPKDGANDRLKRYWEKRLEVIERKPAEHLKEAASLSCWIKDCPLEKEDAFDLEIKTLNLCQGKLKDNYEARDCVKALCSYIDKKNILDVIRCVRLIAKNPPEYMYWEDLFGHLDGLFDAVLGDVNAGQDLIQEAMGLADDLGRLRVFEYRETFEKLSKRLTS